LTYCVRG